MLFYRQKKKEQTDALHHEYGVVRNCAYIIRAFLRYRKSVVAFLVIGGIAGASMSYIWTVIAKLVIDMITRQSGAENADITPLLWLVIGTTVVEFVMMWLNTLSAKKLRIGFMVTRNELVQERIAKTLPWSTNSSRTRICSTGSRKRSAAPRATGRDSAR